LIDVTPRAQDFIIHPLQLAQAVEAGATAAVLVASVLGPALEDVMDAATIMGTETIVEVNPLYPSSS
jgi:indole-3-glycerol phosphate synthase